MMSLVRVAVAASWLVLIQIRLYHAFQSDCASPNENNREWIVSRENCSFKQAVFVPNDELSMFRSGHDKDFYVPNIAVLMLKFVATVIDRQPAVQNADNIMASELQTISALVHMKMSCRDRESIFLAEFQVGMNPVQGGVGITNALYKCLSTVNHDPASGLDLDIDHFTENGVVFELEFSVPSLPPLGTLVISDLEVAWRKTAIINPSIEYTDLSMSMILHGVDKDEVCRQQLRSFDGMLMSRVVVAEPVSDPDSSRTIRILCGIFSTAANHETNIDAIRHTWGPKCTGMIVFSTVVDVRYNSVELFHDGPESYSNMWQKTRAIWKYVHAHYLTEFDYFYLCGDDTVLIPENLVAFLGSERVRVRQAKGEGLYFGHVLKIPHAAAVDSNYSLPTGQLFNSGGSGYVLNAAAVSALMTVIDTPACAYDAVASHEDVLLGQCLSISGILPGDTRDDQQRDRFHPMAPGYHVQYQPPAFGEATSYRTDWWNAYHDPEVNPLQAVGFACCSDGSIAFHYITTPQAILEMYMFVYHCAH